MPGKKQPNYRLAQIHLNYTVADVAKRLGVTRGTVGQWLKKGLKRLDDKRPLLILGRDLYDFLKARRVARRKPCGPGELFCLRCQQARPPAGGMVELEPRTDTQGSLLALCPVCTGLMRRLVNLAQIPPMFGNLAIQKPLALEHINDTCAPSANRTF